VGVIPSPSPEERTSEADVHEFVERVEWAARRVDEHVL
jgi:hypothetical protein